MAALSWISFLAQLYLVFVNVIDAETKFFYTAAVFEHARDDSKNEPPHVIIQNNLNYYQRAAKVAKSKNADVIVFPEYGIVPERGRKQLKPFLETIPDPTKISVNPCAQIADSSKSILRTLSCMARDNSLVVVANMGDVQNCTGHPKCPTDGVFQFNTNVAFDRDGTLLVRYHKEHLYFEAGMDTPVEYQDPVFVTDFGKFATFICFDILFRKMSDYAQRPDVDGVLFPTNWIDTEPQYTSIAFFQGWAIGNNVTLLAANIHKPTEGSIGSGIFHSHHGALGYTFNPDGISKLVVSRIPKRGALPVPPQTSITAISKNATWEIRNDGKDVPAQCLNGASGKYTCFNNAVIANYSFIKLNQSKGNIGACSNGMCCSIDYATSSRALVRRGMFSSEVRERRK